MTVGNFMQSRIVATAAELGSTPLLPGDANGDRMVTFADLLVLAQNYGTALLPGAGNSIDGAFAAGDFNADGSVGFDYLLTLAQNYGSTALTTGGSTALVPARRASTLLAAHGKSG